MAVSSTFSHPFFFFLTFHTTVAQDHIDINAVVRWTLQAACQALFPSASRLGDPADIEAGLSSAVYGVGERELSPVPSWHRTLLLLGR